MATKRFEELKASGNLPSPPGIGLKLLRLTQREDCSAQEIAATLQLDPALTGRILQIANSAAAGGSEPVTTVQDATVRLGIGTVRNVSLGFSLLSSNRDGICEEFDYERFWSESLARGVVAQNLSQRLRCGNPAEAFVCALLSQVGTLALATVHPKSYGDILRTARIAPLAKRRELEQREYGIDHVEVGISMFEDWGLPVAFSTALRNLWDSPSEKTKSKPGLAELMRVSVRIACGFLEESDRPLEPELADQTLALFPSWEQEVLEDVWNASLLDWRKWADILEVRTCRVPKFGTKEEDPQDQGCFTLAVDDDATCLRLLVHHLKKAEHTVLDACDGVEGLKLALTEGPQLVIADWNMPGMDGLELCQALRKTESGQAMYFILLTGEGDDDRIVEAFEGGIDDYIVKPFTPRLLLARVRAGQRVIRLQNQVSNNERERQARVAEMGILNRKLQRVSMTDALTDLPNRRFAMDFLKREWEVASKQQTPLSAIMIDIDHFKSFNDEYGHDVGDLVLQETAAVLRNSVREDSRVCRLGGEEFCVFLTETDLEEAKICAERLCSSVAQHVIDTQTFRGSVTISLGVAEMSPAMVHKDALLKAADEALYVAKESGRNQVAVACPEQEPVSVP